MDCELYVALSRQIGSLTDTLTALMGTLAMIQESPGLHDERIERCRNLSRRMVGHLHGLECAVQRHLRPF